MYIFFQIRQMIFSSSNVLQQYFPLLNFNLYLSLSCELHIIITVVTQTLFIPTTSDIKMFHKIMNVHFNWDPALTANTNFYM